jgi:hypothetical protein
LYLRWGYIATLEWAAWLPVAVVPRLAEQTSRDGPPNRLVGRRRRDRASLGLLCAGALNLTCPGVTNTTGVATDLFRRGGTWALLAPVPPYHNEPRLPQQCVCTSEVGLQSQSYSLTSLPNPRGRARLDPTRSEGPRPPPGLLAQLILAFKVKFEAAFPVPMALRGNVPRCPAGLGTRHVGGRLARRSQRPLGAASNRHPGRMAVQPGLTGYPLASPSCLPPPWLSRRRLKPRRVWAV